MQPKPARLWPDSATILERFRGVFFAQWEELLRLRRVVLKTSDLDDIHDLRVASRRFRAALELMYPIAPKGAKAELRKSVRKLTRVLGGLRNIDEAQIFFRSRAGPDISAGNTLYRALSDLRAKELKRIEKAIKAFNHPNLDRMVREMVAGLNEDTINGQPSISTLAYFSDMSIRLFLPIHRLLADSAIPEHRAPRHALRIAIKKWRYFFEIISTILDCDYTVILELLKEYQSILGRMNDIVEFELLLSKLKLPPDEREFLLATLMTEDALLLENLKELIERKPLTYTFLI